MKIKIENLSKIIKKTTVLSNINVSFESGKIYGLAGKNGSGKTMLMRTICGLIMPSEGNIYFDDKEMHRDFSFPPSLGTLIEYPSFIDSYTGFKNLQIISRIKNLISDEEIRKTLESVDLDPEDKKSFKKYSLGMKQKLGIACAIMEKPDLVILDEPFNALDENSVNRVKSIILNEKDRGAIVIVSCHDKEDLISLSDEIYYLRNGCVTTSEVIDHEKEKGLVYKIVSMHHNSLFSCVECISNNTS